MAKGKSEDKEKENVSREERIRRICNSVNNGNFGGSNKDAVLWLGSRESMKMERFPSGSPELDEALGGGYPKGKFIEIFGGESGGKSTTCLHAIAEHQKMYPLEDVALIDSEFCLAKGTLVYHADEMIYRPIEESVGKEIIVASLVKGKMVSQKAKVSFSGNRVVFVVRCSGGRIIRLTDNHRVLTQDGYKEVSDIVAGDKVFTPVSLPSTNSTFPLNDDMSLYRILGYHIGDGTIGKAEIGTVDKDVLDDLSAIADNYDCSINFSGTLARFRKKNMKFYDINKESLIQMFDSGLLIEEVALICGCSSQTVSRRIKEFGLDTVYNFRKMASVARNSRNTDIEKSDSKYRGGLKNPIYNFLMNFECFSQYSCHRSLPSNLNNYQLVNVLSGMFMSDGCVTDPAKQKRCSLQYSTTSRRLAMDVQAALQRLGIYSAIGENHKQRDDGSGFYRTSYIVWIRGYCDVERFNRCIKMIGYKKDRIEAALEMVSSSKSEGIDRKRENGLIELEVLSVEEDVADDTYDVSVYNTDDNEQNFVADGIIVHNSFDEEYAKAIGVETSWLIVHQPEHGNQALNVIKQLILLGVKLIVVDSVAALSTQSELEGDVGDQQVGGQARMMSAAMRQLAAIAARNNSTIFWTNQIRDKIGITYGDRTSTPGGRALKHYASIRISIAATEKVKSSKNSDLIVASKVKASIRKNKTAPPFRVASFFISFGHGIDTVAAIFDMAVLKKIISKRGAWYSWNEQQIGNGREKCLEILRKDDDLLSQLRNAIEATIADKMDIESEVDDETETPVQEVPKRRPMLSSEVIKDDENEDDMETEVTDV